MQGEARDGRFDAFIYLAMVVHKFDDVGLRIYRVWKPVSKVRDRSNAQEWLYFQDREQQPCLMLIKHLVRIGWKLQEASGDARVKRKHMRGSAEKVISIDPTKPVRRQYLLCLLRLPELFKRGMTFLSGSLSENAYQQILASDNPKIYQDLHMVANKVRRKGIQSKGPITCSFSLAGKPAHGGHKIMPASRSGRSGHKLIDVQDMETTESCSESYSDADPDGPDERASGSGCPPQGGPDGPDGVASARDEEAQNRASSSGCYGGWVGHFA